MFDPYFGRKLNDSFFVGVQPTEKKPAKKGKGTENPNKRMITIIIIDIHIMQLRGLPG